MKLSKKELKAKKKFHEKRAEFYNKKLEDRKKVGFKW